jgi:hypothetical protein
MPTIAVNVIKVLFVAVLYGFLWYVARSIGSHLRTAPPERPSGPPSITVLDDTGTVIQLTGPVVVGRGDAADVVLDDPYASDRHARFGVSGGRPWVEDLGSTNGTEVNEMPVTARVELDPGDRIKVGQTMMELS